MRKLLWLLPMVWAAVLLLSWEAWASDLQWDQTDIAVVDGYVVYFNETGQTDAPYNKTVLKAALNVARTVVTYPNFEPPLKLQIGQNYDIWIVAYNAAGVSGPSNTIQHLIPAYTPPADSLPSGTVITIPNAAVTIRVP